MINSKGQHNSQSEAERLNQSTVHSPGNLWEVITMSDEVLPVHSKTVEGKGGDWEQFVSSRALQPATRPTLAAKPEPSRTGGAVTNKDLADAM